MKTTTIEPPHLEGDLKVLQLPAVTASWRRLAEEAVKQRRTHAEYLADLMNLEVGGRRERRIQRRMSEARFPILKTLDTFDFSAQPGLERDQVLELCQAAFVPEHRNVVL